MTKKTHEEALQGALDQIHNKFGGAPETASDDDTPLLDAGLSIVAHTVELADKGSRFDAGGLLAGKGEFAFFITIKGQQYRVGVKPNGAPDTIEDSL